MSLPTNHTTASRVGFHYYPDTFHYTSSDLNIWLPRLKELGAGWITLMAAPDRAIPEPFLRGILDAGISPVVHFDISARAMPDAGSMNLLFEIYAAWGVRHVALFDRPNLRQNWPAAGWVQSDLVERFVDLYLPLAEAARLAGLVNVFPPLEPGGDYWDTAFLRAALQSIQRRGFIALLSSLVLGAYAWCDEQHLQWGAGGPERWPGARPYMTPADQEDQRGLYIFDWYQAIAQAVLKFPRPILLLGAGSRIKPGADGLISEMEEINHAHRNLAIARAAAPTGNDPDGRLLPGTNQHDPDSTGNMLPAIPSDVLAVCFWLLVAAPDSPWSIHAWYQPDGSPLAAAGILRRWLDTSRQEPPLPAGMGQPAQLPGNEQDAHTEETAAHQAAVSGEEPPTIEAMAARTPRPNPAETLSQAAGDQPANQPITHYLLLPLYDWGASEWHLDAARPFILRHQPTIGFSIREAAHAARVTVIGGDQTFSEQVLANLRSAGCIVRRIEGDGTEIASQLANL